ncbi:uncharacterized protein [Procambarus clarkii]|uniref:uncharacterized protein n=1 Tax=Procambarus clarkii TaxID=6728 RepID=UPI003742B801
MVVLQPLTPGRERTRLFLKRGGPVRRALLLGPNPPKHNIEIAQSLLTISAEEFTKKWNFDPIREVPVSGGHYQWQRVTSPDLHTTTRHPAKQPRVPSGILTGKRPLCSCTCCTSHRSADDSQSDAGALRDVPTFRVTKSTPGNTAASIRQYDNSFTARGSDISTFNNEKSNSNSTKSTPESDTSTSKSDTSTTAPKVSKCVSTSDASTDSLARTSGSVAPTLSEVQLRQTCITDFAWPSKRRRLIDLQKNTALHPPISAFV